MFVCLLLLFGGRGVVCCFLFVCLFFVVCCLLLLLGGVRCVFLWGEGGLGVLFFVVLFFYSVNTLVWFNRVKTNMCSST